MHEILKAIHEVMPITAITVTRESRKTVMGKDKTDGVRLVIGTGRTKGPEVMKLIVEKFKKRGWKTDNATPALSWATVTKNGKEYKLYFRGSEHNFHTIEITPPNGQVSKLQELRLMHAVKMHL